MAEITQRLGFDAAAAISTLGQLQQALSGVNKQLRAFNQAAGANVGQRATQNLQNVNAAAQQASRSVTNAGTALQQTGQKGARAGQQITVSWQTMLRVVQTQIIVRTLSNVIDLFGESADAAQEFGLAVARISLIARGPAGEIDALSESLRDLSRELALPTTEVTKAALEALQNDLGTTEETIRLLKNAAGDLQVTTGTDLVNAINAISSVLKSFNLDIREAESVAGTLFATYDTGRISIDDLANSIGAIAPLSKELSVSLTEMGSSIATITLQGVDAARAITQLRGVYNALLRPTKALQQIFDDLGVSSGKELIETYGSLREALAALRNEVGGDEQAFAKLFGRIRGLQGAINLLNNEGREAERIFQEVAAGAEEFGEKADQIRDTPAFRAQKAWQQVQTTIEELGEVTLQVRTAFIETVNAIVPNAKTAAVAIGTITAALVAGTSAAVVFGASFGAALVPVLVLAAAAGALSIPLSKLTDFSADAAKDVKEAMERTQEEIEKTNKAIAKSVKENTKQQQESVRNFTKQAIEDYRELKKEAIKVSGDITLAATNASENFSDAVKTIVEGIKDVISGLSDRVQDLRQSAKDTRQELEDFKFEKAQRGLSDIAEAANRTQRAAKALRDLRQAASQVTADPATQENFNEQLARTRDLLKEQQQFAEGTRDPQAIREADRVTEQGLRKIAGLEEGLARKITNLKKQLDSEVLAAQEANLLKADALQQKLLEAQANKQKADLEFGVGSEQSKAAAEAVGDLQNQLAKSLAGIDFNLLEQFGFGKFAQDAVLTLVSEFDKAQFRWNNAVDALQTILNSRIFEAQVQFRETVTAPTGDTELDEQLGEAAKRPNIAQGIDEAISALNEFKGRADATTAEFETLAQQRIGAVGRYLQEAFSQRNFGTGLTDTINTFWTALTEGGDAARQQIRETVLGSLATEIQTLANEASVATQAQATALEGQLAQVRTQIGQAKAQGELNAVQAEQLRLAEQEVRTLLQERLAATALISPEAVEQTKQRLDEIDQAAAAIELGLDPTKLIEAFKPAEEGAGNVNEQAKGAQQSLDQSVTSASTLGAQMGTVAANTQTTAEQAQSASGSASQFQGTTQASIGSANALAQAWSNVATQARAAAQAAAAARAQNAFFGGKVLHRQSGGPITRGQDTQLLMAAPGEMVLNQRASRNFAAQITALNAGQKTQYRDQGGPVTTIGDVNVNVNVSEKGGIDGRQIGQDIRRELRRGTLRLS